MNRGKLSNFNSVFFITWKASDYSNVPFIYAQIIFLIQNYIMLYPLSLASQHLNLVPYKTSLFYMHFLWDNTAVDAHTQALLALFKRDVFFIILLFSPSFRSLFLIDSSGQRNKCEILFCHYFLYCAKNNIFENVQANAYETHCAYV